MGPGQIFLIRVRSGQPSLVWVWKISPKNIKFFHFIPLNQKNIFGSGQKVPGQRWVSILFTAGQKYACVGSGQGPSLYQMQCLKSQ